MRSSRGRLTPSRRRILALRCEKLERREVFADFGDAPEPYPTLLADNGASHSVVPGFFLGLGVDEEADGIPSPFGDGDEQDGTIPDEDGISFPQEFVVGSAVEVLVLASAAGKLSVWFDWNADGDWNDADETVFTGKTIAAGASKISINVPAMATLNKFQAARFRFSSQTVLSPTGPALDGEVEDYVLTVSSRPELRGRKFNDLDRDHERDASEPYINGWLIEAIDSEGKVVATATTADVDLNGDGSIDIDTERGVWRLFDLTPGSYTIREAARPEHVRTAPDLTSLLQGNLGPNPSGSTGVGFASFSYNPSTNQVAFRVDYDSLVGALTKVSLHEGDTTQNGPVIADLLAAAGASPGADGPISGHLTLDNTQLAKLLAGQYYVRVDSDTFDVFGELRGQVMPGREYALTLGLYTQLIGLDFGGYTSESRNSVYPGTQGQVVLSLPDLSTATLPLVGSSTFKLYVPTNGAAGDFDLNGREEAALELSSLSLRGYSTFGQIDIALQPAAPSTGLAEERTNSTPGVLDLPPFAVSGSVDQQLSFDVLVTITGRGLAPVVMRSAMPISLGGTATGFPMAVAETLAGTGVIDLVDGAGTPTGVRLTGVALSPNPLLP
ncbi:MAG: GEVED domain-containing protein, partial [Planctomycetota bacterium]